MPITETTFYKSRAEILNDMIAAIQALVPDVYVGPDGNLRLLFEVEAGQMEMVMLANQLLLEDLFVQSASEYALRQHGVQYGVDFKVGTFAEGEVTIQGTEGVYVPIGTQMAYDPGGGLEPIYFETTEDGTLPSPGIPTPPTTGSFDGPATALTAADGGAGALAAGDYRYRVSFVETIGGIDTETNYGPESVNLTLGASKQVNLTAIPIGPTNINKRKVYRNFNGGAYALVATIANNTATTLTDNNNAPSGAMPAAGNLNGLYEYQVSFVTAGGETLPSLDSDQEIVTNSRVRLSVIPLGGPGTTQRRIFRQKDGTGDYKLVAVLNDNTTTVYIDNVIEASLGTQPLSGTNMANRITLEAASSEVGVNANVAPHTITVLTNAPSALANVDNQFAFQGGTDPEDTEAYRQRLLEKIRNPQTGSVADLKQWAEEVVGVDAATVFNNTNMTTPQNGHVTVRISGSGGTIPPAEVIAATQLALDTEDIAGIVIHVTTFVPIVTNVAVTVTLDGTYTLADVGPNVQKAIQDYILGLNVAETFRISGVVDAVYGLPGIADVVVTTPATNQTTGATEKRIPGTITVA